MKNCTTKSRLVRALAQAHRNGTDLGVAFQFDGIFTYRPVLANEVLRGMNRSGLTEVPCNAPRSFVKQKWAPYIFVEKGLDRCYYEFCVLPELSNGLQSGDIWVEGSRRYLKFDRYLLDSAQWAAQKLKMLKSEDPLLDCEGYLRSRRATLADQLTRVGELIGRHQLPKARLENNRLILSPLIKAVPEETEQWARRVYDLRPRVSLTQVLEEVSSWTQWSDAFTHLYTRQPATDKTGLLTAILAAATNLGKTKIADATEGYTADRLAWLEDWYLREEAYARALAAVVELQGRIPLVAQWGSGQTSSSDGQAFPIAFKKPVMSNVNAKYGRDPVSLIYTHVSDRYAPFHAKAISSMVRDATHVLDGLLHHGSDLQIEEHYTDTSGYTEHILPSAAYSELRPLIAGRIHTATIRRHWDEVARLAASIRQKSASASLLVGKLAAYPRQPVASALREIGRIERTLFTLTWLQDPELRRRVMIGLNKGEAHHTLKRAIRFYRRGSIPHRTQLEPGSPCHGSQPCRGHHHVVE